jgi:hypothetical protein
VGEHVFLKVKAKRSSLRLGSCPKLAARYCGPFGILEKIRPVKYMLALSASMRMHNVFHVSLLKKYVADPNHIIVRILKFLVTQLQIFNPIATIIESLKDRQSQIQ